jgi:hypothetical protein
MNRPRRIPAGARGFDSHTTLTVTTEARGPHACARAILLG